jgi:hypothetical protein
VYFNIPIIVKVGGRIHQGFLKEYGSSEAIIMTSSKEMISDNNLLYRCFKLNYASGNQYFTISLIDHNSITFTEGFLRTVFNNNGLYGFDNYAGLVLKMSSFYEKYKSAQIMIQGCDFRYVIQAKNPIELKVAHKLTSKLIKIEEHEKYINSLKDFPAANKADDAALNDMLITGYSDVYKIAKSFGGVFNDKKEDIYNVFKELKDQHK